MRHRVKLHPPDIWLIIAVIALVVIGLWLVWDASYAKAADSRTMNYDGSFLFKKQLMFATVGFLCLIAASRLPYAWLRRGAVPVLCVGIGLLAIVLLPGFGHAANGARSWLSIGFMMFQPSEIAKIGLVLYLAVTLSPTRTFARNKPRRWVIPVMVSLLLIGLVVLEKDLGTAVLLSGLTLFMLYSAGARIGYLILTVGIIALIAVGVFTHVPHAKARWRAFSNPWKYRLNEGYQTAHSLAAVTAGGLTGVGLCQGRAKFYLPASSTDYIFATLVEETGLAGGAGLIACFLLFSYRGLHVAHRAKSRYGSILVTGVVSLVSVQAGINLAVVTASMPPTGLSLPFISYGGSGMIAMLTCAGIVLAVSRQVDIGGDRLESEESGSSRRRHGGTHISRTKRGASAAGRGPSSRVALHR